jgi:hypothetical protein
MFRFIDETVASSLHSISQLFTYYYPDVQIYLCIQVTKYHHMNQETKRKH